MHKYVIILFFSFCTLLYGQYGEKKTIVSLNLNYTTSSKVYLFPKAGDIVVRSMYVPVDKIFHPSIDIRYRIGEYILLGISSEIIDETRKDRGLTVITASGTKSIEVEDGFRFIPIELSLHYQLPFSTETFRFYMGGGAAYYHGDRIRKFGDASISTIERKFAYGIQVSITTEYMITKYLAFRSEMKFRDPEFETRSGYDKRLVLYEGEQVLLGQEEFDSKVNIDGVTFTFGFALHL